MARRFGYDVGVAETVMNPGFQAYFPKKPLADFIEVFWFWEGEAAPGTKERLLPSAASELVVSLSSRSGSGSVLCGAQSESFVLERGGYERVVGVHFRPGGAFPFLREPAGEFHNLNVSLSDLFGRRIESLREQLLEAGDSQAMFRVLERWLLKESAKPLRRHRSVEYALARVSSGVESAGPVAIGDVAEEAGISQRRLIEAFRDEVGMTPKVFARVQRFQRVIRAIGRKRKHEMDWSDLSAACGYFDQAHFVHEFRAFAGGMTPTAYLAAAREHLNHVPVLRGLGEGLLLRWRSSCSALSS